MLSYQAARGKVIEIAKARFRPRSTETVDITRDPAGALGRIASEDIRADRDYPSFDRSIRDGIAVRSADVANVPMRLKAVGESKAGSSYPATLAQGECVHIMTGAPVPAGADAVVMVEYTKAEGDWMTVERTARAGDHIVRAGSEARANQIVIPRGTRIGYADLSVAAQVGAAKLPVFTRPLVAVLATGDELVPADEKPGAYAIRNSNSISLAAQVALSGAEPVILGPAPDRERELRELIERGLREDALVLSGGVSMGKYDLVENILLEAGAEFYFDGVAIRPGRPAVFGICKDKLVFGLPGNPVSAIVTFELLVTPAIDVLSGAAPRPLALFRAKVTHDLNEKPGLAHFLPAKMKFTDDGPTVEALRWQGSGDVVALVDANCFIVVGTTQEHISAGDWVDVFPRRGSI
ncbi:MAG TPA: gephyrin-like molybdotransferase Glp [Candidatus Acidoferrales bacterium]